MELLMGIDAIAVLIDQILNGNMVNVGVNLDIHFTDWNVLEIKLEMILLKIVM